MANYQLSIVTADGEAFNGQVESLIAPGQCGSFGILGDHAPLVASLCDGPLTVTQSGTKNYFALSSGVLEVNHKSDVLLLASFAKKVKSLGEAKSQEGPNDGK